MPRDALDEVAGVGGDELGGGGGRGETVVEHGVEEQRIGLGEQRGVDDDALGEGGVLLEAQAASEERMADEPDGEVLAAVEVEAGEAVELVEEVVAQALGVVEDDDGDDAALVDQRDERALDVGDDLRAGPGPQAELGGQHAVEVERFDRAVAQVDDAVFAAGPRAARVRMADVLPTPGAGEDADAGLAGEHVPALTAV